MRPEIDVRRSLPASIVFLFAAILLYAVAGSPTPDDPGWPEIAIGALLVASALLGLAAKDENRGFEKTAFDKAVQVFFIAGLILPTASAVYAGNDTALILRDLAAFAFLGLPLFLGTSFRNASRAADLLPWVLTLCGLLFCLRTLLPVFNIWTPEGELLYLSNSPLAMFAAIFAACTAWAALSDPRWRDAPRIAFCLAALGVIIAAMLLDLQRATVGAVVLSLGVMAAVGLVRAPRRVLIPLATLGLVALALLPQMEDATDALARKTSEVGLNMRMEEAGAVLDTIMASPVTFFAGRGWGSTFASPAVGLIEVNFTHSFLTMMALKGGLILFLLAVILMIAALVQIAAIFRGDTVKGLSAFWPFIIPCLLYASHKSLDFGLVLLLITVWSNARAGLPPMPRSYNNRSSSIPDLRLR